MHIIFQVLLKMIEDQSLLLTYLSLKNVLIKTLDVHQDHV